MLGAGREGGGGATEVWVPNGLDLVRLPNVTTVRTFLATTAPTPPAPRALPPACPSSGLLKPQVGSRIFGCHASCKGESGPV